MANSPSSYECIALEYVANGFGSNSSKPFSSGSSKGSASATRGVPCLYSREVGCINSYGLKTEDIGKWFNARVEWVKERWGFRHISESSTGVFECNEKTSIPPKLLFEGAYIHSEGRDRHVLTFASSGVVAEVTKDFMLIFNHDLGLLIHFSQNKDLTELFDPLQPVEFKAVQCVGFRYTAFVAVSVTPGTKFHQKHLRFCGAAEVTNCGGRLVAECRSADGTRSHHVILLAPDRSLLKPDVNIHEGVFVKVAYYRVQTPTKPVFLSAFVTVESFYDDVFKAVRETKRIKAEDFFDKRSTSKYPGTLPVAEYNEKVMEHLNEWDCDLDSLDWYSAGASVTSSEGETTDAESISRKISVEMEEDDVIEAEDSHSQKKNPVADVVPDSVSHVPESVPIEEPEREASPVSLNSSHEDCPDISKEDATLLQEPLAASNVSPPPVESREVIEDEEYMSAPEDCLTSSDDEIDENENELAEDQESSISGDSALPTELSSSSSNSSNRSVPTRFPSGSSDEALCINDETEDVGEVTVPQPEVIYQQVPVPVPVYIRVPVVGYGYSQPAPNPSYSHAYAKLQQEQKDEEDRIELIKRVRAGTLAGDGIGVVSFSDCESSGNDSPEDDGESEIVPSEEPVAPPETDVPNEADVILEDDVTISGDDVTSCDDVTYGDDVTSGDDATSGDDVTPSDDVTDKPADDVTQRDIWQSAIWEKIAADLAIVLTERDKSKKYPKRFEGLPTDLDGFECEVDEDEDTAVDLPETTTDNSDHPSMMKFENNDDEDSGRESYITPTASPIPPDDLKSDTIMAKKGHFINPVALGSRENGEPPAQYLKRVLHDVETPDTKQNRYVLSAIVHYPEMRKSILNHLGHELHGLLISMFMFPDEEIEDEWLNECNIATSSMPTYGTYRRLLIEREVLIEICSSDAWEEIIKLEPKLDEAVPWAE